jgi:C4-dicarboxylate-specific signal transduction histidine kinase
MDYKGRILCIDDDATNRLVACQSLRKRGYEVLEAPGGIPGLELIRTQRIDLILLDLLMPRMSGNEFLRILRTERSMAELPVIIVSAVAEQQARAQASTLGANDYVTKPVDYAILDARISTQLDLKDAHQSVAHQFKLSALGEMAGGVAHEINNPLAIISGRCQLLKSSLEKNAADKQELVSGLDAISNATERIHRVVKALLFFSGSQGTDSTRTTSIGEIFNNLAALFEEKLKNLSIRFETRVPTQAIQVANFKEISQILSSLIHNAVTAVQTLDEKKVTIEAALVEGNPRFVRIMVTDSGNGIPPEIARKIFEPFFTTHEVGQGTGMGLSMAQGIAQEIEGRLELDSSYPNTRFVLRVPVKATG